MLGRTFTAIVRKRAKLQAQELLEHIQARIGTKNSSKIVTPSPASRSTSEGTVFPSIPPNGSRRSWSSFHYSSLNIKNHPINKLHRTFHTSTQQQTFKAPKFGIAGIGILAFPFILQTLWNESSVQGEEPANKEGNTITTEKLEQARAKAINLLWLLKERSGSPGVAACVMSNGKIIFSEGVGFADVENLLPMTSTTPLRIASISKSLTAAALGVLIDQDKIDLDAPIQKYVPEFPVKEEGEITTRQLAGHLSGIKHYGSTAEFLSSKQYKSVTEALDIFKTTPLAHKPGEKMTYTTYGYVLLSAVIEKAAGMPFLEFMKKNVFIPAKMYDTYPDTHEKICAGRPRYYQRNEKGVLINSPYVDNSNKWAGGGFVSTCEDIARFGNAMVNGTFLKPSTVQTLWTSLTTKDGKETQYGLGWEVKPISPAKIRTADSVQVIAHSGGAAGCSSRLTILPEDKMVVVVIVNLYHAKGLKGTSERLADVFLNELNGTKQ